jgi:pimeloyl-ACP methyl ester carboxylesterase
LQSGWRPSPLIPLRRIEGGDGVAIGSYRSADELSVAYSVSGDGPGLVLLHGGFVQDRQVWHRLGYVRALAEEYRVVTIDLRGHGASDPVSDAEQLRADRLIGDVLGIADAAGLGQFFLWGFSLGGSVAIQAAAQSTRVLGMIAAGTCFAPELQTMACRNRDRLDELMSAGMHPAAGLAGPSDEERALVEAVDPILARQWYAGMCDWPLVSPADVQCPALVLTGERDLPMRELLEAQREPIERARMALRVLPELDHFALLERTEVMLPLVQSSLHHWSLA